MPYFVVNIIIISLALTFNANNTTPQIRNLSGIRKNSQGMILLRKDFMFAIFSVFVLTIFMGFRNNFTTDYNAYIEIFHNSCREDLTASNLGINSAVEPGYFILNKIIGLVSENDIFFMTVIAALSVYLTIKEAYAETSNIFWFILLYFNAGTYLMGFNAMRQVLAASMTYRATIFLRKGMKKHFVLAILFASFFHRSSLFMLAAFPFLLMKVSKKNILAAVIMGIIFFSLMDFTVNVIQTLFPVYTRYKNLGRGESIETMIIQWGMFFSGCLAVKMNKLKTDSVTERILFNGSLLFVIVTSLSIKFGLLVRLKYFMSMYLTAFTANAINSVLRGRSMIAARVLLILLMFGYIYVRIVRSAYGEYVFLG